MTGSSSNDLRFTGHVIKLSVRDYERWREGYAAIDDLDAELTLADDYYAENPPKNGRWFFAVSRWLQRSNERAIERKRSTERGDSWL